MRSSEVFSDVVEDGALVYERRVGEYFVGIVKHIDSKIGEYYLSYIAVPKDNKFYGVTYEALDDEDIPIFFTYSEYSTTKDHWIIGFDGGDMIGFHESLELANEAYEYFLGGQGV